MSALLTVHNLSKEYQYREGFFQKRTIKAVQNVSFALEKGRTLAIVGETGSGKSVLAKILAGVIEPTKGDIYVNNERITPKDIEIRCKLIRMIFQDPNTSLNPKLQIQQILEGPLKRNTNMDEQAREQRIHTILKRVGLLPEHAYFYPQMLATGQKQRVSLARALILQPSILIADEPLRGLDSSMRSQMINLFLELQEEMGLSYVYVSQHLSLIKHFADDILVMQGGEVIEMGSTERIFASPQHPFTQKLIENHLSGVTHKNKAPLSKVTPILSN